MTKLPTKISVSRSVALQARVLKTESALRRGHGLGVVLQLEVLIHEASAVDGAPAGGHEEQLRMMSEEAHARIAVLARWSNGTVTDVRSPEAPRGTPRDTGRGGSICQDNQVSCLRRVLRFIQTLSNFPKENSPLHFLSSSGQHKNYTFNTLLQ